MATYNKFNQFVEDVAHGVHNLGTDAISYALTNTLPVATNSVIANITEIAYTNLTDDGPGARAITVATSEGSDGSYELVLTDLTITAVGGAIAQFRYVVIFNNTPTSPLDPLISWFDYGSAVDVLTGETFKLDFGAQFLTLV